MKKPKANQDLARKLLAEQGFRTLRPVFSDPAVEAAFLDQTWHRNDTTWNKGLKIILPLISAMTAAHWLMVDHVALTLRITEVGLILFLTFCLFMDITRVPDKLRPELTLGLTLIGQAACIAIFAFSVDPGAFVAAGYLAVIVGSIAPNRLTYQVVAAVLPAVAVVAIIFTMDVFTGRFAFYHIGFGFLSAGLAISIGIQHSESSRIEFLLTRHAHAALAKSDRLLGNMLPEKIAARMKDMPADGKELVDSFADVTVLFADLVGFTSFAASHTPEETVRILSDVFRRFDAIAAQCGIEKIKTIGDAYMAVGGLPEVCEDHTQRVAEAALEMREAMKKYCSLMGIDLQLRIGIHSGPVIAGVIGTKKFLYDLWGDTVNVASRLESHGLPGQIQVSEAVAKTLGESHELTCRGTVELKGKGLVTTYILERPKRVDTASPYDSASAA